MRSRPRPHETGPATRTQPKTSPARIPQWRPEPAPPPHSLATSDTSLLTGPIPATPEGRLR
ncbi:hypothetical protein [Lysobacter gummosus]|uniref:hypothetical protein n=1 Tax=Lysobacter gummosus TaxID=262324 RepID=UPI00363F88D0